MDEFPIAYEISNHEKEIVNFFGEENVFLSENDTRFIDYKFYFVCFTNRCGSNMLCELLGASNSNIPGENLNYDAVINNSKKFGFKKFSDYLFWLIKSFSKEKNFGIKCSYEQLLFLYKYGIIANIFIDKKYILMKRKATLEQAISFYIADKTKQWTSYQSAKNEVESIDLKTSEVLNFAKNIFSAEAGFKVLFEIKKSYWHELYYEDLVEQKELTLNLIFDFLKLTPIKISSEPLNTQKQESKLKTDLIKKLLYELNK